MLAIHPQARTTPAVRAKITRSLKSSSTLAKRYGISAETVRKWRKRGPNGNNSKGVLKPDLDLPCGPRPPGGSIAVRACAMKPI